MCVDLRKKIDGCFKFQLKHVPWKSILKSMPVWALIFAQIGTFCGFAVISFEMPTYFNNALGIDLQNVCIFCL